MSSSIHRMLTRARSSPLIALPLRSTNFALFTGGIGMEMIGGWMMRLAAGWLMWQLTESGFWLGMVAFADYFPTILVGPLAGAFADRLDKIRLLKMTALAWFATMAALWALTMFDLTTAWVLVGLVGLHGIIISIQQPARLSIVPSLVAEADLGSAVAINSVVFNIARFIGPIVAGLVIVHANVATVFAISSVGAMIFWLALQRVQIVSGPRSTRHSQNGFRRDFWEGVIYTVQHPAILAILVVQIAIGLGGRPIGELLPGLADAVYQAGAGGLSTLAAAIAVGGFLGSLWMGNRGNNSNMVEITLIGSIVSAAAATAAIATRSLWIAVPAVAFWGFASGIAGVALQTYLQLVCSHEMRGRVMGLYSLIFRAAPALGALTAGAISTWLGLRWPIFLGAVMLTAVCVAVYLRRDLHSSDESEPA